MYTNGIHDQLCINTLDRYPLSTSSVDIQIDTWSVDSQPNVINHALQYIIEFHSNYFAFFVPLVIRDEILVLLRIVFHVLTAAIQDDPANKNFMDEVLSGFLSIFIFN